MPGVELKKESWSAYFEKLTRALQGKQALVEVGGLPMGNPVAVQWIALLGITYDRKDDLLDLDLGEIEHIIHHPVAIHVEATATDVRGIEVVDADRTKHVVRLREPLMLPHPA